MASTFKLTTEQSKAITAASKDIVAAATSTAPMDRSVCVDAIGSAYDYIGLKSPEVIFLDSPVQAIEELKKRATSALEGDSPSRSSALSAHDISSIGAIVMDMMRAALPRTISALGDEVDITFNGELNRIIESSCRLPIWRPLSSLVDKRLRYITHYSHAVNASLESLTLYREQKWLIYSGGAASIWDGAEGFARVQALFDTDSIKTMPKGQVLGLAVLKSCGWVNAFKKVCVVCDRPSEVRQIGKESGPDGVRTEVVWRDKQVCQYVYT